MSKDKNKLIPELRFSEFENDGEWEAKILDSLTIKISDGIHTTPNYDDNGEYYFINGNNLIDGKIWIDEKTKRVSEEEYIRYKRDLNESTILLSINGTIGNIARYSHEKVILGKSACYINVNEVKVDKNFIFYFIQTDDIKSYFNSELTGSTIKNLSLKSIKETIIEVPVNPREQQKIVDCISSLDELITAHSQKLELLKDHKKGLMQNLFPQEGETVPRYRFPEFVKEGEWVEKKLRDIAEIITGNTPSTSEPVFYKGEKLFVSPADINENRYVKRTKTTLTELGFSKTRPIKANSVLFVCIGSTIGKVAQNKVDCATNQQINSLTSYKEYSNDFLYSILENNATQIASIAGNQAVPIINKSLFSSVELSFPPTLKEQQKIAACLSSLDELITLQADKIDQLKFHKKGLMQGLFPKVID